MVLFYKFLYFLTLFKLIFITFSVSATSEETFDSWLSSYKIHVISQGISERTVNIAFKNVKFLEQVIKYDRKQPEFFEDTRTYVGKRANNSRLKIAKKLLKKNKNLFLKLRINFLSKKKFC